MLCVFRVVKVLHFSYYMNIVKLVRRYKEKIVILDIILMLMSFSKAMYYSASDIKISELRPLQQEMVVMTDTVQKKYNQIVQWCQDQSVFASTADDDAYHFKFRQISSSPYVIYGKGNVELLHQNILAVVWPRNVSSYGKQVTEHLFQFVKTYNLVTISGLADGVDMLCHELSIEHTIPTIAVLWAGLERAMKSSKREMIQKIIDHGGLVLSEFKLDKWPERYTFPQRNRIVAWLSDMVFVPEAAMKSGSLITVDFARGMHKDVYGAPWSIFSPTSQGLGHYMQQWLVKPVVDIDEMLGQYFGKITSPQPLSWQRGTTLVSDNFEGDVSEVIVILQKNPDWLGLNELVSQTGLGIEEVMSQLSVAEVMGQVMNDGGVWRIK